MENNSSKNILDRIDRRQGYEVPEGYFESFADKMTASLPRQPWESRDEAAAPKPARRSVWQAIRPYVYMAAMFCGIWLMMQMFGMMRTHDAISPANSPVLAEALKSDSFINSYILDDSDSNELLDDLWDNSL